MKKNSFKIVGVLFLFIFCLSIGYAYLTKQLEINGVTNINKNSWNIYFANAREEKGSVPSTKELSINSDKDEIHFETILSKPTDYYEFQVDMVNDGTIDAMIEHINKIGLDPTYEKYITFSITYLNNEIVKTNDRLNANTNKTIKVRVEYNDVNNKEDLPPNDLTLNLGLQITYIQATDSMEDNKKELLETIKKDAKTDTEVQFGSLPNETNGLFQLTKISTSSPIYYYRGDIDNNNVIFGGFCWKIIRTTETGGIKIIYNGVPNNGVCDATGDATEIGKSAFNEIGNEEKYIGYMYEEEGILKDSTIKTVIDTWFENNLLSFTDYLEDAPFYNETDYIEGEENIANSYAPRNRIWGNKNNNWSQTVPNATIKLGAANTRDIYTVSSSIGNGALTYPIGLLTSDEATLAGGKGWINGPDGKNRFYYLYTGSLYWTMSPAYFEINSVTQERFADMIEVYRDGSIFRNHVKDSEGVRPVISLKPNIKYLKGTGTKEEPFIITE